jgi:predicted enzyme related to lactoylglutathione lyase
MIHLAFDNYRLGENTVPKKSDDAKMDYIEFPAKDLIKTKAFYEQAFGWRFTDYGPDYTSFEDGRLAGGFTKERRAVSGGPLVVIYGHDLPTTERKVLEAGGQISRETFSFPGGRRFHFTDPNGNELAVWSENS